MIKTKKLIIIGNTSNARLAKVFFTKDSEYDVTAFCVDKEYISSPTFENLPLVSLDELKKKYPPTHFDAFVAIGYKNMNKIRERLYHFIKKNNYNLPNYISSRCTFLSDESIGDNNLILEDNTIQPFVKIGNNNVLWSGNHIGHDAHIEDHCFITSHVVVSGFVNIKSNCFLGVNSTIRDGITINKETLVGAGAVITKDTNEKGVYLPPKTILFDKMSDEIDI